MSNPMSETIDYRLLRMKELITGSDECYTTFSHRWVPVPFDWVGQPVTETHPPIRRRTTLRDELAELAGQFHAADGYGPMLKSLRALIRKHYPNAEQGSATSAVPTEQAPQEPQP